MKRYISLALCALAFIGLGSCNKVNETDFDGGSHSVTFRAQLGGDTRTGLALKFVPDWRETKIDNVHLFETYNGEVTEGEDVKMETPVDGSYEIAYFTADYGQMTIIVNPPSSAPATRADASNGFTYGGIVAQRENNNYVVPATQYPKAATLIDPNADFLVGHSLQSFPTEQSDKQVNLKFIRPVAISRLSIMNLGGTKVMNVKITSADALVGTATYENINFEEGTVAFTGGSKVLTLDYGTGTAIPAEGIFDAYFISLTGSKRIQKIEVTTDAGLFTKDLGEGKTLTFKVPDFKSIAVNMADSGSSEPSTDQPQNISFVRGGSKVTTDSYDLYSSAAYVTPTVTGQANGATLTYSSSDEAVATVSVTNGVLVVNPIGTGETTISVRAGAVTGYQAGYAEYTLNVTDSTPEPVSQSLAFVKNGNPITEDSFDLASGAAYVTPTLTGKAEGATVTYAISCIPEGVATIAANGAVTPVAEGVAIITATASAVTGYLETSKSYTLNVTNTTTPEPPVAEATYNYVSGSLSEGTYLIVSYDTNADPVNAVALFPNVVEKSWGGSSPANPGTCITEKKITLDGNNPITTTDAEIVGAEVELIASGSGWKVKAKKTGEYLVSPTSSEINHVYFSTNESDGSVFSAGSVSGNGRSFTVSGSNLYFFHSGSANGFTIRSGSTVSNLRFYKKALKTQTLSFNGETAVYDLNGYSWTTAVPALDKSGAFTDVTYSSSNNAVAMVDASTGAVSIATTAKKGDSATITATAVEANGYASATATYTISIVDSTPGPEPVSEATYNYVTNLEEGTYLMVGSETSNNTGLFVCLFPEAPEKTWTDSQNRTFTGQVLNQVKLDGVATDAASFTTTDASIVGSEVELVASGSNWKVLVKKTGEYLAAPTKDYEINYVASESSAAAFTAGTVSSGKRNFTTRVGSSTYYFYHSGSANGFSIRTTSTQNMRFYKRAKKTQTLAFAGKSAEYDLADGGSWITAVPDLDRSGAETDVTYGSSNTAVAEVNPTTGAVTIPSTAKKGDTAVITATAVENEEYEEATANYTITISDSTPGVTVTYYKADALVDGEEYLIVSNDHALKNNSNSIAAVSTPVDANDQIKLEETDGVLWKATYDGTGFMLMNGDSYINLRSNSLTIRTSPSSSSNYNYWTYNADAEQLTINSRYLYYNNSTFTLSTSAQKAALYTATPQLPAWEISFSIDAAEFDLNEKTWTPAQPTLTTAASIVTYASSDETVATVSATGAITAIKKGTTTITATAVADATHKKAEASYKLTVTAATVPGTEFYTKISSRDDLPGTSETTATGNYLFVYENGSKAYVFKAILNGTPTGAGNQSSGHVELTKEGSAIEVNLTANGIEATDAVKDCQLQLAHHTTASRNDWNIKPVRLGTYWIRINNDRSNGVRVLAMTSAGYSATFTFEGTGNNVEILRTDSSRNAYWSYNATSNCFEATSTASKISVYKLVE